MFIGHRLGKSIGEVLDLTQDELFLWLAYFEEMGGNEHG